MKKFNTKNSLMLLLFSQLILINSKAQQNGDVAGTGAPVFKIGISYGNSLMSVNDKFEFQLSDGEKIIISSSQKTVYFSKKFQTGQTYRIKQVGGTRTCNFSNLSGADSIATGTIGNEDVRIIVNCGFPTLTIIKMNITGILSGETFKFSDNYSRSLTIPFSGTVSLGGFPVGDPLIVKQTDGPRACTITTNSGVVPANTNGPLIITCDCRKSTPPSPPSAINYDLVSRSTDNKIFASYYETATPVIGGTGDTPGGNEGRYIAYVSYAKGIDGSSGKYRQIFWRDRTTGKTKLISRNDAGEEANANCLAPAISADGRSIAYESYATNLSANDNNGARDIYLWNIETGKVRLISKSPSGESGNSESMEPAISGDGNIIAFSSNASNIVAASNGGVNVFVHDVTSGITQLISRDYETGKGAGGSVPSISEDGTRIAFCSFSYKLTKNDNNNLWDIFLWQYGIPDLRRISITSTGGERDQGTESSSRVVAPAISGNGKMIAYATTATNVVPGDLNGLQDVFLYNIETGEIKRVSTDKNGLEGNGDSPIGQGERVGISYDGSLLSFNTNAENLGVLKGNILLKNTVTNSVFPVTNTTAGSTARPMLSRFGTYVIAGTSEKYDKRYPSSGIFTFYSKKGN